MDQVTKAIEVSNNYKANKTAHVQETVRQ